MPAESRRLVRGLHAGAAVAVLAALALTAQAALSAWLECGDPRLRDPEYGRRLARLRHLVAGRPDRPLVLALGSSRVAMGLRPAPFDLPDEPGRPRLFNCALVGSGPIMELMCLQRLLADHVRPSHLLVEVWPPYFYERWDKHEIGRIDVNRLTRSDVELLCAFSPDPSDLVRNWRSARLVPWSAHRFEILCHVAPDWVSWMKRHDYAWRQLDDFGWLPAQTGPTDPDSRRLALARHYGYYGPIMRDFTVSPVADRALRALLALARREGIGVTLVYLPEAAGLRGWYSPAAWAAVSDYLGRLVRAEGVPLIDAREWAADEMIPDGIHLTAEGASRFTARLVEELFGEVRP